MPEMSWDDWQKQAGKASNAKKAEAEKKLNINNENIGKLENTQVTISGESDTGKYTITGTATPEFLESLNSTKESEVVPDFKYGSGNTTIGDFTRRFYGNNATEDQMRGIAAAIFGKDFKQQEGSDISKYTFDNSRATEYGTRVGAYLANNQQGLNVDNIDSTPYVGTNIRSEFNEVSGDILKRENIYSRLNDIGKMEGYSDLTSKEVNDISEILSKGNVGDLTDEQVKKFQEVRKNIAGMKSEIEQIAIDNGKNADDIFSKKDKSFANLYGDNQVAFETVRDRSHFLNYDVVDGSVVEIDPVTNSIDYLKVAEGRKEYTTAKSRYNFNGTAMQYLEKNPDATFGNADLKKLIELKKSGVDIGDEGERILQGYAYAGSYSSDANNPLVNNLGLAAQQQVKKYDNISDENIAYLKGEGGLQLEYTDGKFGISQQSIDLMTDDEKKKYQTLLDSNDVGRENLSELGGTLDRRYKENQVVDNINAENAKKIINDDAARANYLNNLMQIEKDEFESYFTASGWYDHKNRKIRDEFRDSVNTRVKEEVNRRIGEELQRQQENTGDNISEYKTSLSDTEIKKIEDSVNSDFKPKIEGEVDATLREKYRTYIEKTYIENTYSRFNGTSFENIRKGASSNYDRITGSYAPKTGFGGVALSDDEVLKRSGVEEEALRKEILGANNFDELSPEAMGALYKANQTVSDSEALLGNLKIEQIDDIAKYNPDLAEKIKGLSAEQQREVLGKQLGIGRDGLRGRLDISMRTGLDLNDPKVARDIMEKLGGEDAVKHMGEILNFTGNKNGYGDFGNGQAMDVIEAARKGNLQDAVRKGRVGQMYTAVSQILDEIKSKHGEDFGKEYGNFEETFNIVKDKFDPEKLKKQSKDFTDAEKEAFDNVIDAGISATSERSKELGKGFKRADGKIGGITKFFGNNGGKFAGAALGIGAIFGVAAMASNASEERERKRQEMNQLLAAQSANIRGGY